jgi:hypothetical protein
MRNKFDGIELPTYLSSAHEVSEYWIVEQFFKFDGNILLTHMDAC